MKLIGTDITRVSIAIWSFHTPNQLYGIYCKK